MDADDVVIEFLLLLGSCCPATRQQTLYRSLLSGSGHFHWTILSSDIPPSSHDLNAKKLAHYTKLGLRLMLVPLTLTLNRYHWQGFFTFE